jgi:hypothetical protein
VSIVRRVSQLTDAPQGHINAFYGIIDETDTHFKISWYFHPVVHIDVPKDQCIHKFAADYSWYDWIEPTE